MVIVKFLLNKMNEIKCAIFYIGYFLQLIFRNRPNKSDVYGKSKPSVRFYHFCPKKRKTFSPDVA